MAQIFSRGANTFARSSLLFAFLIPVALLLMVFKMVRSPLQTDEGVVLEQPVPFSHDHHTAVLGIHCGYCHTSVEKSSFAGLPPTETCINCHKQIWSDSPMLEPVRVSFRDDQPIEWNRVYDLPDYVYFNHSIHVAKGIGCKSCHGPVNEMPLIRQAVSLQMQWCLDCHRNPERFVRPREEVYNMDWQWDASVDPLEEGRKLVEAYDIDAPDTCSTCHR